MTNEQLRTNSKCPFGGGRDDCACNGNCVYHRIQNPREPITKTEITYCECRQLSQNCSHPNCTTGIINASRDANQ